MIVVWLERLSHSGVVLDQEDFQTHEGKKKKAIAWWVQEGDSGKLMLLLLCKPMWFVIASLPGYKNTLVNNQLVSPLASILNPAHMGLYTVLSEKSTGTDWGGILGWFYELYLF